MEMFASIYVFFLFAFSLVVLASEKNLNRMDLRCVNKTAYYNVSLFAYHVDVSERNGKPSHADIQGIIAYSLQDYIENNRKFVTVAGDINSGIPYGTKICIEELNEKFGKQILFEIRDQINSGNKSVEPDFGRLAIYVRSEKDTHDIFFIDRSVTIYI